MVKLEDLINKRTGLSLKERKSILEYIKNKPVPDQESQPDKFNDYITTLIIILNSMFEYGFLNHRLVGSSDGGDSSSYSYSSSSFGASGDTGGGMRRAGMMRQYKSGDSTHAKNL